MSTHTHAYTCTYMYTPTRAPPYVWCTAIKRKSSTSVHGHAPPAPVFCYYEKTKTKGKKGVKKNARRKIHQLVLCRRCFWCTFSINGFYFSAIIARHNDLTNMSGATNSPSLRRHCCSSYIQRASSTLLDKHDDLGIELLPPSNKPLCNIFTQLRRTCTYNSDERACKDERHHRPIARVFLLTHCLDLEATAS